MAKVRTTYEPQWYRHLPTRVQGLLYDGHPRCAEAIMAWAPGKFVLDDYGRLCNFTPEGLRYVPERNTALLDVEGCPYSVRESVMAACYVTVDGADHRAVLSAEQVQAIRAAAELATDPKALREMVAQLAGSHEAQRS